MRPPTLLKELTKFPNEFGLAFFKKTCIIEKGEKCMKKNNDDSKACSNDVSNKKISYLTSWSKEDLCKLYDLRKEGKSFSIIGKILGRGTGGTIRKYNRTNWQHFFKNPNGYVEGDMTSGAGKLGRLWTQPEMIQLYAYLEAGKSYSFIAKKLNRTVTSIESRFQRTDWKAWKQLQLPGASQNSNAFKDTEGQQEREEEIYSKEEEGFILQLVNALLGVCRHDFARLNTIKEKEFLNRVNLESERLNEAISFYDLKGKAIEELNKLGFGNPETLELGQGRYIIVGDSHGKQIKRGVFALLKEINKFLKPNKIIHIGHILDDDNDISYDWGGFKNLIVLSKIEELRSIQEQRFKYKFDFDIVRESISLGDLAVFNQDLINDYVTTSIKNLNNQVFDERVVINLHRMEFHSRPYHGVISYFASPGCLCERHIARTVKQIDFTDGKIVKQALWDGFSKYRRMRHTNKFWEMGLLVVEVDKEGNHTIIPCPIKKTDRGFTTSYFDKLISATGVFDPEAKTFVNGDLHCDKHDISVLDVQESVVKDYKPDNFVDVGDSLNFSSLNHHIMDRGGVIIDKEILSEAAQGHFVLKRLATWAKNKYIICGNHERFAKDFVERYPQFGEYLDFKFLCDVEEIGYHIIPLKKVLKIGAARFIHGEMKMFGQTGDKLDRAAKTFGRDIFIGHIHCPAIRSGCYSVGLSGKLDQDYNEPEASEWIHGFALCNHYKGKCWPTTIAIIDNQCRLNGKTYRPSNLDSWKLGKYKVRLHYDSK